MSIPLVDLKAQYQQIKPAIDAAMTRVVTNTHFIMGQEVKDFEAAFAAYMQVKHAVGVSSGTDAIFLALLALGVGPGDEVITTPHTFIASAEPIVHLGAKPVFVDVDPGHCTMGPCGLELAITPRTKAVVHVRGAGAPRDACRGQLNTLAVQTAVHYPIPVHLQPAYRISASPRATSPSKRWRA